MKTILFLLLISPLLFAVEGSKPLQNDPLTSINSQRLAIVEGQVVAGTYKSPTTDLKWSQGYAVILKVTCTGCTGEIRVYAGIDDLVAEIVSVRTAIDDSGSYIINIANAYYRQIVVEVDADNATIDMYLTRKNI